VLAVNAGEPAGAAYEKHVASAGVNRPFFDDILTKWSASDAQRVLKRDLEAESRSSYYKQAREQVIRAALPAIYETISAERNVSVDEAKRIVYRRVIEASNVAIHDSRYSLPALENF
jgi:hypothetical protein